MARRTALPAKRSHPPSRTLAGLLDARSPFADHVPKKSGCRVPEGGSTRALRHRSGAAPSWYLPLEHCEETRRPPRQAEFSRAGCADYRSSEIGDRIVECQCRGRVPAILQTTIRPGESIDRLSFGIWGDCRPAARSAARFRHFGFGERRDWMPLIEGEFGGMHVIESGLFLQFPEPALRLVSGILVSGIIGGADRVSRRADRVSRVSGAMYWSKSVGTPPVYGAGRDHRDWVPALPWNAA